MSGDGRDRTPDGIFNADRRVAVLGIARMADAAANSFLVIVLPLYIASGRVGGWSFGLGEAAVTGVILALFGVLNSAAQPFIGRLSDRLGKRQLFVLAGLLLTAAMDFAYAFAHSYWLVLLIRGGQGIAAALAIVAGIALVNEYSVGGGRGGNMGTYNSFRLIGFGIGPLAAGIVVEGGPYALSWLGGLALTGFEATFYLATIGALLSALLVLLLVRDPEHTTAHARTNVEFTVLSDDPDRTLDSIFTLGLATFLMAASISVLSPIEPLVNARLDQGPVLFAVEFSVFILSLALAQPFFGSASDQHGRRPFIFAGLLLLVPTTFAQGLVVEPWQMITVRLVQGLAGAMIFAPAFALAGDLAGEHESGATLSVLTVGFGLGLALGQLSSGFLVALDYLAPFAFGAALAALGAVLVRTQVEEEAMAAAPAD